MNTNPLVIFIDTSIFEAENFFLGRNFTTLCELSKTNIVKLKITDIIYEEIKQRIKANLYKAQISTKKSLQTLNGESKILKNIPKLKTLYDLLNIEYTSIENELLSKFEVFLKKYNFEIVNSKISSVNDVFNNYFNTKPPFKDGLKKNEFPDAFSISTILRWSEINKEKVIFLTNDSDFSGMSVKNIDFSHSISTLLDYITTYTNEIHTSFVRDKMSDYDFDYEIQDNLESNYKSQLREAVEENILVSSNYYDPEIDNLENFYAIIESKEINSIERNKSVIFEITASISFNFNISYYDISNAFYDKEDDEWYGKEAKNILETFTANIICLAGFNYNLDENYFAFEGITNFEVERLEEV